jgi:SAM-dependent MidA family methyltransferase
MDTALYHPDQGFYARPPVGESEHYVTAPHVSRAFGVLVARQVREFWDLLGRPDPFTVVEIGAGDGTLARQVIGAMDAPLRTAARYCAVERSPGAREAIRSAVAYGGSVTVQAHVEETPGAGSLLGCVLGNEVLDNVPFHRVRRTEDGWVELMVGVREGRLALLEGPLSDPALLDFAPPLAPGQEAPVSPQALRLVDRASAVLSRGYVWLVDYGFGPTERPQPVHGYRRHRVEEDVLLEPGSRDVTAGVDFGALARHADAAGLRVWGPRSQRDVLLALGFEHWDRDLRHQQVQATAERRGVDAMRLFSERNRASLLIDRSALGRLKVVCIGVGDVAVPPTFAQP